MTARLTSLSAQALFHAADIVVPRPLPSSPPRFSRVNWTDPVEVTTTWLSDTTRATETGLHTSFSLRSRPVRSITAKFSGMSKAESESLRQSIARLGSEPCPFPLYCDARQVFQPVSAGVTELPISTSLRRFFPGGRVIVISTDPDFSAAAPIQEYAEIHEVFSDRITLKSPLQMAYPLGVEVIPCIDATLTSSSSASNRSDHVLEVEISATEVVGQSTLPPIYRGHLHGLFPRYIKSRFPVGDPVGSSEPPLAAISPDWRRGLSRGFERNLREEQVGKGYILEAREGAPYATFAPDFLQLSREDAWELQALFDCCRGRVDPFFFLDPQTSWEAIPSSVLPIGNVIDFRAPGVAADYESIRYISLALSEGTSTTFGIFKVNRFLDIVGQDVIRAVLEGITPLESAVLSNVSEGSLAIRPAYLCAFDTDALSERWETDTVLYSRPRIAEKVKSGSLQVMSRAPQGLQPPPAGVEGLQWWFAAGANCFNLVANGRWVRTTAYPDHNNYQVDRWFDARYQMPEELPANGSLASLEFEGFHYALERDFDTINSPGPALVCSSSAQWMLAGRRAIINPDFKFGPSLPGSWLRASLGAAAICPWSNDDGMTMFLVVVGGLRNLGAFPSIRTVMRIRSSAGLGASPFRWDDQGYQIVTPSTQRGRIDVHRTLGVSTPGDEIYPRPICRAGKVTIAVVRWTPNGKLESWHNGDRYGEPDGLWQSANNIPQIAYPDTATMDDPEWLSCFDDGIGVGPSVVENQFAVGQILLGMMNYRRALPNSELNTIGRFLANAHNATWQDV